MKIHFLKNKPRFGAFTDCFIMITEKKIVQVDYTGIKLEEVANDEDFHAEVGWYIKNYEMQDSTKQEFDDFYIKIATEINNTVNDVCLLTSKK